MLKISMDKDDLALGLFRECSDEEILEFIAALNIHFSKLDYKFTEKLINKLQESLDEG